MKISSVLTYLAAAAVITILSGLVYVSVQQNYRMGANDPQVQLAKDISNRLAENKSIEKLLPQDTIDLTKDPGLFIVLYNSDKQPVLSTAILNNKPPQMPNGVLEASEKKGEDRISWQPQSDVRMAMVIQYVNAPGVSYVAVGRSLKEAQVRIGNLGSIVLICWLMCMGVIVIHLLVAGYLNRRNK